MACEKSDTERDRSAGEPSGCERTSDSLPGTRSHRSSQSDKQAKGAEHIEKPSSDPRPGLPLSPAADTCPSVSVSGCWCVLLTATPRADKRSTLTDRQRHRDRFSLSKGARAARAAFLVLSRSLILCLSLFFSQTQTVEHVHTRLPWSRSPVTEATSRGGGRREEMLDPLTLIPDAPATRLPQQQENISFDSRFVRAATSASSAPRAPTCTSTCTCAACSKS